MGMMAMEDIMQSMEGMLSMEAMISSIIIIELVGAEQDHRGDLERITIIIIIHVIRIIIKTHFILRIHPKQSIKGKELKHINQGTKTKHMNTINMQRHRINQRN